MKTFLSLIAVVSLLSACSTTETTDASGNKTTTTAIDNSAATQAAITSAVQIATAAANAAIQTYLTSAPHARLAAHDPVIDAAKTATEADIRKSVPSLSPLKIHNIVSSAYAKAMHGE